MSKKGKTPSLIGTTMGTTRFVTAKAKRHCVRCNGTLIKGTNCIEVTNPGALGHRTFCKDCYLEILTETQKSLNTLNTKLAAH